jgi:hypothetical protein
VRHSAGPSPVRSDAASLFAETLSLSLQPATLQATLERLTNLSLPNAFSSTIAHGLLLAFFVVVECPSAANRRTLGRDSREGGRVPP